MGNTLIYYALFGAMKSSSTMMINSTKLRKPWRSQFIEFVTIVTKMGPAWHVSKRWKENRTALLIIYVPHRMDGNSIGLNTRCYVRNADLIKNGDKRLESKLNQKPMILTMKIQRINMIWDMKWSKNDLIITKIHIHKNTKYWLKIWSPSAPSPLSLFWVYSSFSKSLESQTLVMLVLTI